MQLDRHQILTEAAFHECYVDRHARYWEVPQALSVDVASNGARGGLRYRLGVHHSAGVPLECGREDTAHSIPLGALPGTQIQAGASLEKSLDIWKGNTKRKQPKSQKSYSLLETRPHISLSGIAGKVGYHLGGFGILYKMKISCCGYCPSLKFLGCCCFNHMTGGRVQCSKILLYFGGKMHLPLSMKEFALNFSNYDH